MSAPIPLNVALDTFKSLGNEAPHASRSDRYQVISTREVLTRLYGEGFSIYQASEKSVRNPDRVGYQKHLVRLRHATTTDAGHGVPDIILTNAHDGAASFMLLSGWIEFACSNGLIIGDVKSAYRIRHTGDVASKVIDAAYKVISEADEIKAEVADMRATMLPNYAVADFAERAHALRFGESDRAPVSPASFDIVRRYEDANQSLWSVYNRVQENTIRGGMRGRIIASDGRMRRTSVRAVSSIDKAVSINSALHGIAREMLNTYSKSSAPALSHMYRAAA